MKEIFKDIPNHEHDYSISNYGRIQNKLTNRILNGNLTKYGYVRVTLYKNKKSYYYYIHCLVLLAFLGPKNGLIANHKDGNKANNILSNLEYVTHRYNTYHSIHIIKTQNPKGEGNPNAKLTEEDVFVIRHMAQNTSINRQHLASLFGISKKHFYDIINRKKWK